MFDFLSTSLCVPQKIIRLCLSTFGFYLVGFCLKRTTEGGNKRRGERRRWKRIGLYAKGSVFFVFLIGKFCNPRGW